MPPPTPGGRKPGCPSSTASRCSFEGCSWGTPRPGAVAKSCQHTPAQWPPQTWGRAPVVRATYVKLNVVSCNSYFNKHLSSPGVCVHFSSDLNNNTVRETYHYPHIIDRGRMSLRVICPGQLSWNGGPRLLASHVWPLLPDSLDSYHTQLHTEM